MEIFREIKYKIIAAHVRAEQDKLKKEQERQERKLARQLEHEQTLKKIREEYMGIFPVSYDDILGMRESYYTIENSETHKSGELIEFFLTDGTRCFLVDRNLNDRTSKYYTAPDSISCACDALSCVIPRFKDVSIRIFDHGYGNLDGLEEDRWPEIRFSEKYLKMYIDSDSVNTLSTNLYEKVKSVTSSWDGRRIVQILGREAYDGWKGRIEQISEVVSNNQKTEAAMEEACRKEEYRREREKKVLEEKNQMEEEIRRAQEKQAQIIVVPHIK